MQCPCGVRFRIAFKLQKIQGNWQLSTVQGLLQYGPLRRCFITFILACQYEIYKAKGKRKGKKAKKKGGKKQ